jgi:hypothetical protein
MGAALDADAMRTVLASLLPELAGRHPARAVG